MYPERSVDKLYRKDVEVRESRYSTDLPEAVTRGHHERCHISRGSKQCLWVYWLHFKIAFAKYPIRGNLKKEGEVYFVVQVEKI